MMILNLGSFEVIQLLAGASVGKKMPLDLVHAIPLSFSLDRDILRLERDLLYLFRVRGNPFLRESIVFLI